MKLLTPYLCLLSAALALGVPCVGAQNGSAHEGPSPAPERVTNPAPPEPEDLNSLSLNGHPLPALPPLPMETGKLPDFTREMIRVQWRDDDPIYLFVVTPKGIKKPPVVIYLYSYPSEINLFLDEAFCKLQIKNGFAAVGFLSALTGHRYHSRPMREWFVSELKESLVKSVHDVSMIMDYIGTRSDLDSSHVGMFGEGSGGTIAILAASVEPRLKAIDVLDPWGDWPNWFATSTRVPDGERFFYVQPEFLKRVAPLDPVSKLPSLILPIRYQYLTKAALTPQVARDHMQAALPKQAVFIPQDKGLAAYTATRGADFFDWIKDRLR
jgi:hypothetical protein